MGTGVTGAAQSLSSHPSAGREPLEERGVGEGRAALTPVRLPCSHGCCVECAKTQTHTLAWKRWEGCSKKWGQSQEGANQRRGDTCTAFLGPLFSESWGPAEPHLAGTSIHSPRAGRAQRGRPPCCTASPLGHSSSSSDPSGILEGGEGPRKLGKGPGGSKSGFFLGQYLSHLPQSLSFGLTYPPESSKKSSGGGEAGGGKEGARNLSRSPLMGSGWEALSP